MTGKFLYRAPTPHHCDPPNKDIMSAFNLGHGTRWQCECGKRWIYLPAASSSAWVPLRWWHRWTQPMKKGETP